MIPLALSDDARRGLARLDDVRADPDADDFDHRRACQAADDAEAALAAAIRRAVAGPRDPGAWGGRYRGPRAVVIRDAMYVLAEPVPWVDLEPPIIIRVPVEALAIDDVSGQAEILGLRDTLIAQGSGRD